MLLIRRHAIKVVVFEKSIHHLPRNGGRLLHVRVDQHANVTFGMFKARIQRRLFAEVARKLNHAYHQA